MRALALIITIILHLSVGAQTSKKSFSEAIKIYEENLGISFSYDTDLESLVTSEEVFITNDINKFNQELEDSYPLALEAIDDGYYTISIIERTYFLEVIDSLDGLTIGSDFGVQVVVNDAPIATKYQKNSWRINYKISASDRVTLFSQGYKAANISVNELFKNQKIQIRLGLPTTRLNTIIVEDYLTKGINLLPSRQQVQIDVADLPLLPGETDGDIFASLSALPGITNPDGRAGNLLIRGSETDQSLVLYDNIPIYHRGHYYGTISPYNPKVVDNVEVYRSGFHPGIGDRVGGVIVINSDDSDENSSYGVGANTLFGMMYGKPRFSDKWSGTFGVRSSYTRKFDSPKLTEISESVFSGTSLVDRRGFLTQRMDVDFSDFNAKLTFDMNPSNRVSLSHIYSVSDINFMPVSPPGVPQRSNDNSYENAGINLSWNSDINEIWTSEFLATYSNYEFEFVINTLAPNVLPLISSNSIKDFNLAQEFSKNGSESNIQLGIDYKWQEVSTDYSNQLNDSSRYRVNRDVSSSTIAPYANIEYFGLDRWYFQVGVRSSYYTVLEQFNLAPRVLANFDLTSRATLKGSFGIYNQFLSQVKNLEYASGGFDNELWTIADDKSGFLIDGTQSMLGVVINSNSWVFDAEGFYKTANNITIYENRFLDPSSDFYTMDQETYGVDFLLKKQLSEFTSLWTGYSFHDSKIMIDTTNEVSYKSKFVQPHVWYIGGAYSRNRWKASIGWRFASGLNARSLDIVFAESSLPDSPEGPPLPDGAPPPVNPFQDLPERYPNVQSLDISVSYKIPKTDQRDWSATFGLSIVNALNRENLTDRVFRGRDGLVERNGVGFAPNLMVIFEW